MIVDEGQDLHPAQWRPLRAAVRAGPDDLFISAGPHRRSYGNRVSLASLGIGVRGRSRRLTVNYRTTQEILAWAVPLLGPAPVTGPDGEADSLAGYRSPMHGRRRVAGSAATRQEEFINLAERISGWLAAGIEPHAIGVAARSTALARQARDALNAAGIPALALATQSTKNAVQAVAVIGVEQGTVPAPAALTPASEGPIAHEQDLQRERCVLFVACTRARDHLYVSCAGQPSPFLP